MRVCLDNLAVVEEVVRGIHALKRTISSLLDGSLDGIVRSSLLNAASQVNNGDVGGWHTHGHSGELSIEGGDDFSDSLGSTGARWDNVLSSGTSSTPILGRWAINSLLGCSVGVNGSHETLNDGELVVDDLGERGKAVGCARGIGNDLDIGLVCGLVDAHNVHWGISGGCRDDNLLSSSLQVCLGLLGGSEDTGRLDNVVGTSLGPRNFSWVTARVELDGLSVNFQASGNSFDGTLESAVGGVVL
jgi:hypothetical protein